MTLQFGLITALWLVAASALVLLATIWQRGQVPRKPWLAYLALASAAYAFGYGLELAGDSVEWVLATFYLQHPAIAFSPTIILLAAIDLGRLPARLARTLLVVSLSAALLTIALVYTNPLHDLYHAAPRMEQAGPLTLIAFDAGAWYVAFQVFTALMLLFVNAVFVRSWLRSPPASALRAQAATVALASLVPWIGSLVYLSGVLPLPLDVTPLTLAFTTALIYLGVTRYALADPSPIARDLVFERMRDPVLVLDVEGGLLDANAAASQLPGLDGASGPEGEFWLDLVAPEAPSPGQRLTPTERPSAATMYVVPPIELGGRRYDPSVGTLSDRRGRALGKVVVLRDVTEQADVQRLLVHLATTDELTGLANRRRFLELAERMVARAVRDRAAVSVVVFDLDGFKAVNDEYGHQMGDAVLRSVARNASACLRPTDLLGRYGGEEFAACLPNTDAEAAGKIAERLRAAVQEARTVQHGSTAQVTASVGVCTLEAGASAGLETLLARADAAQYEAKRSGGDSVAPVTIPRQGDPGRG